MTEIYGIDHSTYNVHTIKSGSKLEKIVRDRLIKTQNPSCVVKVGNLRMTFSADACYIKNLEVMLNLNGS